jgi:hypothetical protein
VSDAFNATKERLAMLEYLALAVNSSKTIMKLWAIFTHLSNGYCISRIFFISWYGKIGSAAHHFAP